MPEQLGPSINPEVLAVFQKNPREFTFAPASIIPPSIMEEAQSIVQAHKPAGLPSGFEPVCSLSIQEEKEIDSLTFRRKSPDEQNEILTGLRAKYAGDPDGLKRIDIFDPRSPYRMHMKALIKAYRGEDDVRLRQEREWFRQNLPDVIVD